MAALDLDRYDGKEHRDAIGAGARPGARGPMSRLAKWRRQARLAAFRRASPERLAAAGAKRTLRAFHRAAADVPAYRKLLAERGVDLAKVRDIADFQCHCPVLDKETTFGRHALAELVRPGALERLAAVQPSSGRGGDLAFGLTTRAQARRAGEMVDLALAHAFAVDARRTLLINCLPMGVRFAAASVTVADVSVREDLALALAANFGPYHDQLIFVGDPLFLKQLGDEAAARPIDWRRLCVNVIVGEEAFGENFRAYLADRFAIDLDDPEGGLIGSSLGVGEIGLNLLHETRGTISSLRVRTDSASSP
jgi:phenylacetate-CoA ligase